MDKLVAKFCLVGTVVLAVVTQEIALLVRSLAARPGCIVSISAKQLAIQDLSVMTWLAVSR